MCGRRALGGLVRPGTVHACRIKLADVCGVNWSGREGMWNGHGRYWASGMTAEARDGGGGGHGLRTSESQSQSRSAREVGIGWSVRTRMRRRERAREHFFRTLSGRGCYPGIDEASQIRFRPMRTRFVCSLAPGTRVWDPPGTVRVWCSARVRGSGSVCRQTAGGRMGRAADGSSSQLGGRGGSV